MIDLSIVVVPWNTRERVLEREHPALTRIEYYRSLDRFFRSNRRRSCMAIVLVARIAKSLSYVLSQPPPALQAEARR